MAALAVGVAMIEDHLPNPVYGMLSGLNSATVGIVALAAVQLAENAIKDQLSRIVVLFGACAGLCYTALWYFPVLMVVGGAVTALWDMWLGRISVTLLHKFKKQRSDAHTLAEEATPETQEGHNIQSIRPGSVDADNIEEMDNNNGARTVNQQNRTVNISEPRPTDEALRIAKKDGVKVRALDTPGHSIPIRVGIFITIAFFGTYFVYSS
jgi:hypothetical protein